VNDRPVESPGGRVLRPSPRTMLQSPTASGTLLVAHTRLRSRQRIMWLELVPASLVAMQLFAAASVTDSDFVTASGVVSGAQDGAGVAVVGDSDGAWVGAGGDGIPSGLGLIGIAPGGVMTMTLTSMPIPKPNPRFEG
jgi:hypothetical protein